MKVCKNVGLLFTILCTIPGYAVEVLQQTDASIEEIMQCGEKLAKADWNTGVGMGISTLISSAVLVYVAAALEPQLTASWPKYIAFWSGVSVATLVGFVKGIEFFDRTAHNLRETYKSTYDAHYYKLIERRAAFVSAMWKYSASVDGLLVATSVLVLSPFLLAFATPVEKCVTPPDLKCL